MNDSSKALRSRLLSVPALRARYMAYVHEIAEKWLDWKKLEPIVRARQALIAEDVKSDTRKLYSTEAFAADVSGSENSLQALRREATRLSFEMTGGLRPAGPPIAVARGGPTPAPLRRGAPAARLVVLRLSSVGLTFWLEAGS